MRPLDWYSVIGWTLALAYSAFMWWLFLRSVAGVIR